MGGMTIGLMGNAEQVSITNVAFIQNTNGTCNSVTATVQNTGSASATIVSATIDATTVTITNGTAPWLILKGQSGPLTLTSSVLFTDSAQYTIKLTTAKGNTIVYAATYSGP
jgi:hypothetical protein